MRTAPHVFERRDVAFGSSRVARIRRSVSRSCDRKGRGREEEEDGRLQEVLVDLLRVETLKAKMKDAVEQYTVEEEGRLRDIAKEAHEDFDRLEELNKKRTQLEFGSALADIESTASEMEEQIRKSRAEREKDAEDLEAFEKNMEEELMTGLFFRGIHKTTGTTGSKGIQATSTLRQDVERATNDAVDSLVLRWLVYLFLAVILGAAVLKSMAEESASDYVPGLYACILLLMSLQMRKESDRIERSKKEEDRGQE